MTVDSSAVPDGIHVLHVDDALDFADMAAEFVEREDERITVRTAPTPEDGLALLAEHDIDCIVSDYDMPGTNGIEFLQSVRTGYPELPFILYTGKGSEEVASDAISAGVTDYLQKQTGADQYTVLANRITNAVESRRSKRALKARNQELQRYERIINSMLEAACIYDEEGHFETVNDYLADWYGKTPEELEGTASNLVPEIRAQYEGDPYREILDGDREFLKGEVEAEFPGHGEAVLEYLLTPLAVDGSIEGVVGVTRDVTERTIRERELQQTREEYQELFDGMNDMAWVIDVDGSVVTVNDAAVETLGYTRTELTSMSPHDIDEELDDETITQLIESMPEDGRQVVETVHRTKAGSDIPVEISSSLITYRGRTAILSIARDVSKRKERREEIQGVLDSMDDAVFLHRDDGSFSFVNRAAIERYGYDEDELLSMRPRDLDVPAEIPNIADRIQRINEDGQAVFETTHRTRSGETFPVEINATSVTYRGESAILAIARDITERTKRQREMESLRERLELAVEGANLGVWDWDMTTDEVTFNEQWTTMLGYDLSEIGADLDTWKELVHPDDLEAVEARLDAHRTGERAYYDSDHRMRTADGDWKWIRDIGKIVERDADGEPVRAVGIHIDIDDRKDREQAFETMRERMTFALTVTNSLIFGIDLESNAFRTMYGPVEDLIGVCPESLPGTDRFFEIVVHPDDVDGVKAEYERFRGGAMEEFAVEYRTHPDHGPVRWIATTGNRQSEGDTHQMIGLTTDITDRKRRERALERQNDQLEQFANVVSHDLRNPLNVATGRLELAESDCPSDHHAPIGTALDRMSVLIDDLLTLAQEGESIDQIRAVSLADSVDSAWESVDTGIATLVDDTDREIVADESRLRQLLENLFRNSVEHGSTSPRSQAHEDAVEHGGENVTVTVGDLDDGFYVADDGVGIPPADRKAIFEMSYSTSEAGTGLGLSIVKQVVDAHGWDLRVTESAEGGARFEITGVESPAQ